MRQSRIKFEGERAVYHCMSKVVGGDFLLGDWEKEVLRKQLWQVADFCGIEILTYCLMDNHFHVLLRTPRREEVESLGDEELLRRASRIYVPEKLQLFAEMLGSEDADVVRNYRAHLKNRMGDVSQYMKELKQRFSIWYNRTHGRLGTLWAERFKSVLVQDDPFALSTIAAYIDLNPVRAGLTQDPGRYRFCCYGEAMGGARHARRAIGGIFDGRYDWAGACGSYRILVFGKGLSFDEDLPGRTVDPEKAREVLNAGGKVSRDEALRCRVRYFSDGAVLGSREFVQSYFETHRHAFSVRRRDGPRRMRGCDWGDLTCIRDLRRDAFG